MTLDKEKEALFRIVRSKLGAPIRSVELSDDILCDLLAISVGDYAERAQNFVIENNWAQMYGKNLDNIDLAYAMSVRTLDITKDYSYYFSKEVGLQQRGTFELKKDFFEIENGRQVYVIPPGREINKVMWVTPPTMNAALFANYGGIGIATGGGGYAQLGLGTMSTLGGVGSAFGLGAGLWALNAYDVTLMAADMKLKNQLFRGDLTYKVTAGPDGSHLVHLMSTPGSKLAFGQGYNNGVWGLAGCRCWYTYYDVTPENVDDCRQQNPDVVLSPDQVPLAEMDYSLLNPPTKALVRQLLVGHAAETLGLIRGKFSGNIQMINSPLTMEYNMLLNLGQRERQAAIEAIDKRFERMSPYAVMAKQKDLVENLIGAKKGTPLGIYVK